MNFWNVQKELTDGTIQLKKFSKGIWKKNASKNRVTFTKWMKSMIIGLFREKNGSFIKNVMKKLTMVGFVAIKITTVKKGYKTRISQDRYRNTCFILWKDRLRICFAGFESNLNTNVEPTKAPKLTTSSSKQVGKTSNSFLINETGETVSVTLSKKVKMDRRSTDELRPIWDKFRRKTRPSRLP